MRTLPAGLLLLLAGCPYISQKEFIDHLQDWDGDGSISVRFGGEDCKDEDPSVLDCDFDDDGELSVEVGGDDCDDHDASVFPGAPEVCDGVDQDCDGQVDEVEDVESPPAWIPDRDGDGYGDDTASVSACDAPDGYVEAELGGDCDDTDGDVNPGAVEFCDDLDWDCDGDPVANAVDRVEWAVDGDGDGVAALDGARTSPSCEAPAGAVAPPVDAAHADCDDARADTFPGAAEVWYDGVDQDCAGDDDFDADHDGSGRDLDCDDTDPDVHPGATEVCNGRDDDCDTRVDDEDDEIDDDLNRAVRYRDGDGDGYGDDAASARFCVNAVVADYVAVAGDCDDGDEAIHPGADELCDLLDNDCDGSVNEGAIDQQPRFRDSDGDGFGSEAVLACSNDPNVVANDDDCDDADPDTWPGAQEICGDNVRQDCSDKSPYDCDGDGYDDVADGGTDCDDTRVSVNPDAREICDGLDNDCDGRLDDQDPNVDLSTIADWYVDADGDGYGDPARLTQAQACAPRPGEAPNAGDCDDRHADANPDAREACDGYDNDCDGLVDDADDDRPVGTPTYWLDLDGDGFGNPVQPSNTTCLPLDARWVDNDLDCQPGDGDINPFALEVCDGLDNDCDGMTDADDDDAALDQWYLDQDGDGFGQSSDAVAACGQPMGRVAVGGDCDDFDAARNPGASEICDGGLDDDCDGLADDADPDLAGLVTWWPDLDSDGYGDGLATPVQQCGDLPGYVNNPLDCDDLAATRSPAAPELCNGQDDDCDTLVDDEDGSLANAPLWYADRDVDGWGSDTDTLRSCDPPAGYRPSSGDCDDGDDAVFPTAAETCNGRDDDCDGFTDDLDVADVILDNWYVDADGDGVGSAIGGVGCGAPPFPLVAVTGDCDDADPGIKPGAPEVCDGRDDDCDGLVDDADPGVSGGTLVYPDADGDGYGALAGAIARCAPPAGFSSVAGDDCAPTDPTRNPGAREVCNGLDDDCDGSTDEEPISGIATFADGDGDGFGAGGFVFECAISGGRSAAPGDCDDGDGFVHPGAPELCDGVDNDCDGTEAGDPDLVAPILYTDADGDGFGTTQLPLQCVFGLPPGASVPGDCDDGDPNVSPAAIENCDGRDQDCDGLPDWQDPSVLVGPPNVVYADADGDGFYATTGPIGCAVGSPSARPTPGNDCNDADAAVHVAAVERCNGVDDDCDGAVDDADDNLVNPGSSGWVDLDGDGFGAGAPRDTCSGGGLVAVGGDCDDGNPSVSPGRPEICNALVDDDCDGLVDEQDPSLTGGVLLFRDVDNDTYGLTAVSARFCGPTAGWSATSGDCDDANGNANPGKPEACNGFDDDCDGLVDDADPTVGGTTAWINDADHDGFGLSTPSFQRCQGLPGQVPLANGGDCDDANVAVHPGATETCATAADDDCDGVANDLDPSTADFRFYDDQDGDGWGVGVPKFCAAGPLRSSRVGDCNDAAGLGGYFYPGQSVTVPSLVGPSLTGLQQAIDAVCDDADITVLVANETNTVNSHGKTLRIRGPSTSSPGHVSGAVAPVFLVDQEGVTLSDLLIETTGAGSVLSVSGVSLELERVTLEGGGGVGNGGGLFANNAQIIADGLVVRNNAAGSAGGGARIQGGLFTCLACLFELNSAPNGSALSADGAAVWIADSTFRQNAGAGFSVDLLNGPVGFPIAVEDSVWELDGGLQVQNADGDLKGLRMVDGGHLRLSTTAGRTLTLTDSDIVRAGAVSSATLVMEGAGNLFVQNNRFLQSQGGDSSTTGTTHHLRNNTFIGAFDTMIHVVSGQPEIVSNTFVSTRGPTVNVSQAGGETNIHYNVFDAVVPSPLDGTNLGQVSPLFQTYHPNLPAELWDLHLPFGAPQIDAGSPLYPESDATPSDAGAYGGIGFDPYYTDGDMDGMADNWELFWFGTLAYGGYENFDVDGASNLDEFVRGTRPYDADTDDDGCEDYYDFYDLDPFFCGGF